MNKELAIYLVIGTAAVGVIYYLYTRLKTGTTAPVSPFDFSNPANPSSPNSPDYNGIWDTSPVD